MVGQDRTELETTKRKYQFIGGTINEQNRSTIASNRRTNKMGTAVHAYQRNRTASPETSSLLADTLDPLVKRCLHGWPAARKPVRIAEDSYSKSGIIKCLSFFMQSLTSVLLS